MPRRCHGGERLVLVYCSTKAAVISMTRSAGLNLIRHGTNVDEIAPGVVNGAHWDHRGVSGQFRCRRYRRPDLYRRWRPVDERIS